MKLLTQGKYNDRRPIGHHLRILSVCFVVALTPACRKGVLQADDLSKKAAPAKETAGNPDREAIDIIDGEPVVRSAYECLMQPPTPDNAKAQTAAIEELSQRRLSKVQIECIVSKMFHVVRPNSLDFNYNNYPAVVALRKIGEPAVGPICERLEMSQNSAEQLMLLDPLVRIKGKQWVVRYLSREGNSGSFSSTHLTFQEMCKFVDAGYE